MVTIVAALQEMRLNVWAFFNS